MKFENTIDDVKLWLEYVQLSFPVKLIRFIVLLLLNLYVIYSMYKKIFSLFYKSDIASIIIFLLYTLVLLICYVYGLFFLLPKLINYKLKIDSNKLFREKKIFYCHKDAVMLENGIRFIYDNHELTIDFKENIAISEFKGSIFITKVIMKNKNIKIYPIVIPINKNNNENILFISTLKSKIRNNI